MAGAISAITLGLFERKFSLEVVLLAYSLQVYAPFPSTPYSNTARAYSYLPCQCNVYVYACVFMFIEVVHTPPGRGGFRF